MFKDKISQFWEAEKFLNHFRDPFRPGPMVPAKNAGMSIVILPFPKELVAAQVFPM